LIFVYFPKEKLEIETIWLVSSIGFAANAYEKSAGERYKSFYRFNSNPDINSNNKWSRFVINKSELGDEIVEIIKTNKID